MILTAHWECLFKIPIQANFVKIFIYQIYLMGQEFVISKLPR